MGITKGYSLFIVEDHAVYRMGLKELIKQEDDLWICGEADNAVDAWEGIKKLGPDMVILDLSLKDGSGFPLIKDIGNYNKDLPVLVLSMYDETLYAERVISAGAKGYIMKQEAVDSIVRAIRHIQKGKIFISENIATSILHRLSKRGKMLDKSPVDLLTDRELEVFCLMGRGLKAGEIAGKMHLSVRTVGTYRERIKQKLSLKSSADLIKHAALWVEEKEL